MNTIFLLYWKRVRRRWEKLLNTMKKPIFGINIITYISYLMKCPLWYWFEHSHFWKSRQRFRHNGFGINYIEDSFCLVTKDQSPQLNFFLFLHLVLFHFFFLLSYIKSWHWFLQCIGMNWFITHLLFSMLICYNIIKIVIDFTVKNENTTFTFL